MPHRSRHLVLAALLSCTLVLALAAPSVAAIANGSMSTVFEGAFEFEGNAARPAGKRCRGAGAFGVAKAGARVRISQQDRDGEFDTLARGKLGKGKIVETAAGDEVCRMTFRVKVPTAPADDSRLYLEVKGLTFDISWPATDVADGDLGTWRCEFSDTQCALLVGEE
jgi:hypothetical protein